MRRDRTSRGTRRRSLCCDGLEKQIADFLNRVCTGIFAFEGDGRIAYKLIGPITAENLAKTLEPEIAKAVR